MPTSVVGTIYVGKPILLSDVASVRYCKVSVFLVIDRIFIQAAHEKRNCHKYNFLQVMREKIWMEVKLGQTCVHKTQ